MFWILTEFLVLLVLATFFATQLIIPLWQDRPLFPVFRRGAVDDLEDQVNQSLEEEDHLGRVLRRKRRADHLSRMNLEARMGDEEAPEKEAM